MPLTHKQQRIYDFIEEQIERTGLPPTFREIALRFAISVRAVQDHVAALEKKGSVKRAKERARGILIAAHQNSGVKVRLPILGSVPAGRPVEAIAQAEDFLSINEDIAKRANFVLRVKGDSMFPKIEDGDLVLVRSAQTAEDGEIVVAYFQEDGEVTVKKLRKRSRRVYLEAINPAYPPIGEKPFSIVGTVTSLIRPDLS
ncbi:MAG: repressor LexA [Elusimicrobia bacterium]|nr:repressor LexA [Elusimicrobiota bacterium]